MQLLARTPRLLMDNVYQSPSLTPPPSGVDGAKFDLDRALNLGWQSFKGQIGLGVAYTIVLALLSVLAVLSCFGILFALPHLAASSAIMGLLMVRGKPELGDMFRPFRAFGAVLGAWLLITIVTQLIAMIFTIPYYAVLLHGVDWSQIQDASGGEAFKEIMQQFQKQQQTFSVAKLGTNLISLLNLPVSLYIGARLMLTYPLIIERGIPPMEAIRQSLAVTRPFQWPLMGFGFITGVIAGLGILGCCVGILFTVPLAFTMHGAAIYQLLGEDTGAPIPGTNTTQTSI